MITPPGAGEMLYALVLFCSAATPREECNEHTALRYVEHPVGTQLVTQCLLQGNIVGSAWAMPDGTYMVVRCVKGQNT